MNEFSSAYLLVIFLSWLVALTPPLIIRYAVLKRPMDKWPAIGICALFGFLEISLFTAIESQSKTHGAPALVAIISFWILRRKQNLQTTTESPSANSVPPFMEVQDHQKTHNLLIKSNPVSYNEKPSKAKQYTKGIDKSKYYEQALAELETNSLFKSTWAMAYSEADGDENKARARYIRMRADKLDQERQLAEAAAQKKVEIDTQTLKEELYINSEPYRLASDLLNEFKSLKFYDYQKAQALIAALGGVPCIKQSFLQQLWVGGVITKLNDEEKHFLSSRDFADWVYTEIAPKVIAGRERAT